jgi:hypothetical protein
VRAKALTLILGQQLDESEIATALSLADSYFGLTPALLTDSIEARDALQQLGLGETKVWKTF